MNGVLETGAQRTDDLVVDMVSDLICPWCFVAKRRIEKAAAILKKFVCLFATIAFGEKLAFVPQTNWKHVCFGLHDERTKCHHSFRTGGMLLLMLQSEAI